MLAGHVVNLGEGHELTLHSKLNLVAQLATWRGAVELMRQVVASAERNPDVNAQYSHALSELERELAAQ